MPTRFLLIDDHALIREGLALALARVTEQVEVIEAESCEQAEQLLRQGLDVDMVVLDMQLPGRSRVDALRALRELVLPAVPIVALSSESPLDLVQEVLAAGARGYVSKSSPTQVVVSALKLVFAGGIYVPPTVLTPTPAVGAVTLTRRQEQVLAELARGATTEEIATRLAIAEVTVRVHIATILRVLRVDSRESAARTPVAQRLAAGAVGSR